LMTSISRTPICATSSAFRLMIDRTVSAAVDGSCASHSIVTAAMSSFIRRGTAFWLPTVAGSVRERSVRREPWLTLTVTQGDRDEHVVVLIEGPADIVPLPEVPADVRAAVTGDWIAAWIRIKAERMLSYASEGALP